MIITYNAVYCVCDEEFDSFCCRFTTMSRVIEHGCRIASPAWSRVYTPCARMRRQPAQMSTLAVACASPLHSASCAVDKSINRRAYASVYVRIRPYAEQRVGPRWPWSAFVIGWNACAGLRWPWKFNMFELWRRQSVYARVCAGRNLRQKYKQLRRQSAYARAWSINPAWAVKTRRIFFIEIQRQGIILAPIFLC